MSFEDWCSAMKKTRIGRITLSNMLYDYYEGRIDARTFDRFKRLIGSAWSKRKPNEYPEEIMKRIINEKSLPNKPHKFFCKGPKLNAGGDRCSRIMDIRELHKNNLDFSTTGYELNGALTSAQIQNLWSNENRFRESGRQIFRNPVEAEQGIVQVGLESLTHITQVSVIP